MGTVALLIIDMQNDFVLPGAPACINGAHKTVPFIKKILEYFRADNLPVFYAIREYRADGSDIEAFRRQGFLTNQKYVLPGTHGSEIVEEIKPIEGEYVIVKNRFSAFMHTELDLILRRLDVKDLVICGTQYPNCIRTTVYDAVAYGYEVTVIIDATSAKTRHIEASNIRDMKNIGVRCIKLDRYLRFFSNLVREEGSRFKLIEF